MADRLLENVGTMSGTYAGTPFQDSRSSVLEVTMAEVPFEKTADQEIWFSGELTMTFTVDNREGAGTLDLIVIRDLLDNTKFKYVENSVTAQLTDSSVPPAVIELEEGSDFTVTYTPGTPPETTDSLVIAFIAGGDAASIPVGSTATITFRGEKVPVP